MRLRRLELVRFGRFDDLAIDFGGKPQVGSDFHVIYGPNEAGKTTVITAVLRLLFGIPRIDREPYSFRHGDNLEVAAEIEDLPGHGPLYVRRIKKRDALLDRDGQTLPADLFDAALDGLDDRSFRRTFLLDVDTIQDGAREVTTTHGDTGKLLFAAHAGLSKIDKALETLGNEADEIYAKGKHGRRLSQLKKAYGEARDRERQAEITLPAYNRLEREAQRSAEEVRRQREILDDLHARERDLVRGRAIVATEVALGAAEEAAAPYGGYPSWNADPCEERLSSLRDKLARGDAVADGDAVERKRLADELSALEDDPAILAVADTIDELDKEDGLAQRAVGARMDLARQARKASDEARRLAEMQAALGIDVRDGLRRDLLLGPAALDALTTTHGAAREALFAARTAEKELSRAEGSLREYEERLEEDPAEPALDPAAAETLEALAIEERLKNARDARTRLQSCQRAFDDALAALHLPGRSVTELPATDLTAEAIRRDEQALSTLRERRSMDGRRLDKARRIARESRETLEAKQRGLADPALLDPEQSLELREAAWSEHRATLTERTAEAFETEMRRHDALQAQRFDAAAALGEIEAMRVSLAREDEAVVEAQQSLETVDREIAAFEDAHRDRLRHLGLPETMSTQALVTWLEQLQQARVEAFELDAEGRRAAPSLNALAQAVERIRAGLPDLEGDEEAVLWAASQRLTRHRGAEAVRRQVRERRRSLADSVDQRRKERDQAHEAAERARCAFDEACQQHLPTDHGLADVAASLQALSGLAQEADGWRKAIDRVAGMRRDAVDFLDTMAVLARDLQLDWAPRESGDDVALAGALVEGLDRLRELQTHLGHVRDTRDRRAEIGRKLVDVDERLERLRCDRAELDAKIERYRAPFAGMDDVGDLADLDRLEGAIETAREATRLRHSVETCRTALAKALAPEPLSSREAVVASYRGRSLDREQEDLERDLKPARDALEAAVATQSEAKRALAEAGAGTATVAEARSEQATLLLDMRENALRLARLRMADHLARQALRRYRSESRGEAMRNASEAFAALTRGAYTEMTSRATDRCRAEEIVVRPRGEGPERAAIDLSEGTRMQLYLALRVAAYRRRTNAACSWPFIADDIFEKFDDHRTTAACTMMHEIARGGQAIYLTHHAAVVRCARAIAPDCRIHFLPDVPREEREFLAGLDAPLRVIKV